MRITVGAALIGCFLIALFFLAPTMTRGDEWNLATRFNVNHSLEVPGMVLQANTPYVIKLFDSQSERHVVQIYDEDQKHMLTMFMAISAERPEATDRTLFSFIEMEPGFPMPIKEWFYPGRLNGLEFVYPKEQAQNIAKHAQEPILSTASIDLHDLKSINVEAISPLGTEKLKTETVAETAKVSEPPTVAVIEEQSNVAQNPPSEPAVAEESKVQQENIEQPAEQVAQPSTEVAQNEKTAETPVASVASNEVPSELPRTAGELPLVALIGVVCLGAGLGMKVLSAKS